MMDAQTEEKEAYIYSSCESNYFLHLNYISEVPSIHPSHWSNQIYYFK